MYYILLTTNEEYAQHCGVCITSLLNNNQSYPFKIVVAGVALSNETKSNLQECICSFNNAELNVIDFDAGLLNDFPQIGYYPKDIYLRLWVDDFFDESAGKVLYLDVDTIVVDSIEELFDIDLDNYILAAVDIPYAECHHRCNLPREYSYFNSGVILFNVPRWRNEDCRQKVLDFIIENKEIAMNPDQDALNGLFYEQRLKLDYIYNAIGPFFRQGSYEQLGKDELARIRNEVKIIHFNGVGAKPWFYTSNHPYQFKYFKYLNQTPWHSVKPSDKTLINVFKKRLRRLLRIESFIKLSNLKGV